MSTRARGDESGDVGADIAWAAVLRRMMKAEPVAACLVDAVRSLDGLPTGDGGTLDAELLIEIVEGQKDNMLDILRHEGWEGIVRVDFALAIWLYTLDMPSVYKAINSAMFSMLRRNASGEVHAHLKQAMAFIKFLDFALKSLPKSFHYKGRCFRGASCV